MHILIIERDAKRDLVKAMAFYDGEREGLGAELLEEVRHLLSRIGENPRLYQVYRRNTHKAMLSRFPFLVLYRFDETHVFVIGIMDGRKSPRKIARRAGKKRP